MTILDTQTLITTLTTEKQDLEIKITNLDTFLNSQLEDGSVGLEIILLKSQLDVMESYKKHLEIRIGIAQEDLMADEGE